MTPKQLTKKERDELYGYLRMHFGTHLGASRVFQLSERAYHELKKGNSDMRGPVRILFAIARDCPELVKAYSDRAYGLRQDVPGITLSTTDE